MKFSISIKKVSGMRFGTFQGLHNQLCFKFGLGVIILVVIHRDMLLCNLVFILTLYAWTLCFNFTQVRSLDAFHWWSPFLFVLCQFLFFCYCLGFFLFFLFFFAFLFFIIINVDCCFCGCCAWLIIQQLYIYIYIYIYILHKTHIADHNKLWIVNQHHSFALNKSFLLVDVCITFFLKCA